MFRRYIIILLLLLPITIDAMLEYFFKTSSHQSEIEDRINKLLMRNYLQSWDNLLVYMSDQINESWEEEIFIDNKKTNFKQLFYNAKNNNSTTEKKHCAQEKLARVLSEFKTSRLQYQNAKKMEKSIYFEMFPFMNTGMYQVKQDLEICEMGSGWEYAEQAAIVEERKKEKITDNENSKTPKEQSGISIVIELKAIECKN